MDYLVQKDIDVIIIRYLFWSHNCGRLRNMLNHLFLCFSERKGFCVLSLDEYLKKNKINFSSLKKGCIAHIRKSLANGEDIILKETGPKTRKKYYPIFCAFGYKVTLSNVETRSKTYDHRKGFLYVDNSDMKGEIPKCKIISRHVDFWENWESTGKKDKCGCETFTALKFLVGNKSDGMSHRIADMVAVKVCSSEKENEFLKAWKEK